MAQRSDGPISKVEWVWLMVRLANTDRDMYRLLRERGWQSVARHKILVGKSDKTN